MKHYSQNQHFFFFAKNLIFPTKITVSVNIPATGKENHKMNVVIYHIYKILVIRANVGHESL